MNYLLTMAHGAEHYRQEAVYLVMSWLRRRSPSAAPCTLLIATDRPASFTDVLGEQAGVTYLPLDPEQLLHWRGGPHGYVHRIKPQLIAHAAGQVGAGAADAFMFLDSDTAFVADPSPLFDAISAGLVVLHAREGSIEGNRRHSRSQGRLYSMAQRARFTVGGRPDQALALDLPLWNSGVVGLRGDSIGPVMAETLDLTDQICAVLPLATAEQVALSAVLQSRGCTVMAAEACVLHYHVFKEFRGDIAAFLSHHAGAGGGDWAGLARQIDPVIRIQPKLAFNRLPKWQRQIRKRLGLGWRALPYPWQV